MVFTVWFGSAVQAERLEDRDPTGSVKLSVPGTGQVRLRIPEAPSTGDLIGVGAGPARLRVVLITPRGLRVTAENAAAAGFHWRQEDTNPQYRDTMITFARPGVAGQYTVQVTAGPAKTTEEATVNATVWFSRLTPTMQGYRRFVRSVPGAQMPNPVPMAPSAILRFELGRDETYALFDVVVRDSAVKVTLALPGGQVLRQDQLGQSDVTWTTVGYGGRPTDAGPDLGLFTLFVMPVQGHHHLIHIPRAAKGDYEIRASQSGKTVGELRAVFFPWIAVFDPSAPPLPGQVRIRRADKADECFAGDQIDLRIGLLGEVGPATPEFRVRIEKTPEGTSVPGAIENLPMTFTRGADGDYHGTVLLTKAGSARIEVEVKGEKASGQAFADQAIFQANVRPVVARILSLDAKAVDVDGDGKFDRLDITTNLDVIVPGEFLVTVYLTDAKQRKVMGVTRADLQVGHQSLTGSIAGWRIWNELREGPYEVHVEQLFLVPGRMVGGVERVVGGVGRVSHLVTEPRDTWDHGPTYGEDHVEAHGILPAPSGLFRLAEVEWDATTPGGRCSWGGSLASGTGMRLVRLAAGRGAELPAGRSKLSFFFDGAAIAAAGAHQWEISAEVQCEGVTSHATLVGQTVNMDAGLYEAQSTDFLFTGTDTLRGEGRGRWSVRLYADNYRGSLGANISLTEVPKELDAKLLDVFKAGTRVDAELSVKVVPGAAPGRYFIGLAATSGSETVTRYLAVDISPLDTAPVRK
jgi:hypothetical protein